MRVFRDLPPLSPDRGTSAHSLFGTLFVTVMAGLAQALQVCGIKEQIAVATMRDLVIAHQLRRVRLDPTAHLTSEQIADQRIPAQPLPARRLIPRPPRLRRIPPRCLFCFALAGQVSSDRCQTVQPAAHLLQLAQVIPLKSDTEAPSAWLESRAEGGRGVVS